MGLDLGFAAGPAGADSFLLTSGIVSGVKMSSPDGLSVESDLAAVWGIGARLVGGDRHGSFVWC